ncbi:hypothetical protein OPV22_033548 [Ensete ventricosum]|uniref:Uncharacterized protein n=1 Tax=Ensete ventricosum TaxID=4639 RepID=A0AAV8PQA8_ENSVE|nr:hypothetical protein OPV22_033548 [Ensete ventricosum]
MDRLAAVEDESTSTGTWLVECWSSVNGVGKLGKDDRFPFPYLEGKGSLDNASVQLLSNGVTSGNFQQIDNLKCSVRVHEVQYNQGKADLSSNLQENPSVQVETSDDVAANLDPTEQKLLFGMDDGHCLEVPLGGSLDACSGNSLCGSSLENIHFGAIPSMQSGSWSTLTQEALQACSNDKGIQEGWSGLSFQKMEHPVGVPKSVIQGYKEVEQIYAQKSKFSDHIDSNNVENLVKRIAVESQKLQSRDNILIHASASSFDGSIGQCSQTKRTAQTSQNMLELLYKVDQSRNTDMPVQVGFDTASPRLCQPSAVQGTSSHLMNRDDPNKRYYLKPSRTEKIDSITQAETELQRTELAGNAEGSNTFIPSLVHLHQKGMDQGKSSHASTPYTQAVHASINRMASSSSEIGFPRFTSNPSDVQQKNCSLLHRMQAWRKADSDLSNKVQSRLKGADFVSNSSYVCWNNDQGNAHEQDSDFKIPAYGELGARSQSLLPSNAKMLSFASKENVLQNGSTPSSGGHCLQNDISSFSACSAANLIIGSEHTCMNTLVSPSSFEKYQMYKNDAVIAEHDGQKITKPTSQQNFFSDIPGSTSNNIMVEHRIRNSQTYTCWPSSSIAEVSFNRPSTHSQLPTIMDQDAVLRSRKRKSTTTELLPWHKVAQGQQSIAELDRACVTNKLFEKVCDRAEALENGRSTTQPRRRLILTTHWMHQLIPAVPSRMLNEEVISAYEHVTFSIAKSALADVCSLISSLGRDYHVHLEREDMFSDNVTSCKKAGDHLC